jgi:endonuclease/exonuclease/phosphatase family metal-dependent hydrolase
MATIRKFTRRLFIISNIVAVVLFLLACANAILHPARFWLISLLGLVFPLLLLLVFVFFVSWLFIPTGRRWALLSLAALLIGWPNIHSFLALHPAAHFNQEKAPHSLRILTWNVRSWDEFITKKKGASGHRAKMMEFIGEQQPDVLCFQEFFESHNSKELPANISYICQELKYPYYFFSHDYRHDYRRGDGMFESGVIVFSRYPILDTLLIRYPRPDGLKSTESLIAADIDVEGSRVRVFTTHLQSVLFQGKDFHNIEIIRNVDDSILAASRSIVKKLHFAFLRRADQAIAVRDQLDKSPYPGIICGDFNDVPNSYTYFTIRSGWQDAFIKKGFGIGRTYVHISPTLRIDYILADPRWTVLQCRKFPLPYSDHNPVIADLQLTEKTP